MKIISNFTTISTLEDDIDECEQMLHRKDTQFMRRVFVKTVFSYFEGVCSLLRRKTEAIMYSQHLKGGKGLNISKIALLIDKSFRISDNGILKQEVQKQPYKNYLAFSIRSFIEESGVTVDFFSDNGWNELLKSMELRHRLTHPSKNQILDINDENLTDLRGALHWFQNTIKQTIEKATVHEIL